MSVQTFSSFDYWHGEAAFWSDESSFNNESSNNVFMQDKVFKVIEGQPRDIDVLYLDRDLDETRLEYFGSILLGSAVSQGIEARMLILSDLQEQDGPIQASSLALKHGWFRIRVADSYFPQEEDYRPETFVSNIFVSAFAQAASVVALARKHHLFVDTKQSNL